MSNPSRFLALTGVLLFLLCTASARADYADPPERVARLDNTQGQVSYSPAGENEWFGVVRNRPLIRGDRLWTDYDARAEFQVGSAAVRIGSNTSVEILDLNDNIAQFQVTQGTLNLSVRRMYTGQVFEVDTPTLAFTINQAGRYRIDVDPGNNATTIGVWEGAGEAYGENANFPLLAGDTVGFYSTDLRDYEMYGVPPEDDFDRYCLERDRLLTRSASLRYLDDDVVGYADLDEYGSWRPVRSYGTVWFPSRVEADWAPYRDGHWVWQEPWGWTWVDDAPWGFAPSHYGRWVYVSHRWGWIPGPRHVRPVYAPALVAFVSDRGWGASLSLGGGTPIGWFPLGPREVYVPSYQASRDYFTRVNVNNTVVNNTSIINVYNNYSSGTTNVNHVTYANRTVAGAITVVSSTVFVNAQPVRQAAIRLDRSEITSGAITRVAPIAPSVRSVIGAGKPAEARPSREAFDRQVFVRNAPPPVERPFAAREQQLQKNPGRPLEPRAINSLQSRDTSTSPNMRVIGEQRGAVDARAAGSRRSGDRPSATPGQLRPLDRSTAPGSRSGPVTGGQTLDKANKGRSDAQQQLERQRLIDTQQQELRQRKADSEQQAAKQQQLERQRLIDTQQQELRQRKADSEQQAAKQQQLERQRLIDTQQQELRQRKADSEQQAAKQQQLERQRLIDTQQEQRQRQAAPQQEQRQGQRQAAQPQQGQAAQPQQGRAAKTPQELQAECERQAIQQHHDPQQCRSKTQPQANPNDPNGDKNRNN